MSACGAGLIPSTWPMLGCPWARTAWARSRVPVGHTAGFGPRARPPCCLPVGIRVCSAALGTTQAALAPRAGGEGLWVCPRLSCPWLRSTWVWRDPMGRLSPSRTPSSWTQLRGVLGLPGAIQRNRSKCPAGHSRVPAGRETCWFICPSRPLQIWPGLGAGAGGTGRGQAVLAPHPVANGCDRCPFLSRHCPVWEGEEGLGAMLPRAAYAELVPYFVPASPTPVPGGSSRWLLAKGLRPPAWLFLTPARLPARGRRGLSLQLWGAQASRPGWAGLGRACGGTGCRRDEGQLGHSRPAPRGHPGVGPGGRGHGCSPALPHAPYVS